MARHTCPAGLVALVVACTVAVAMAGNSYDNNDNTGPAKAVFRVEALPRYGIDFDWDGSIESATNDAAMHPTGFDYRFDACGSRLPESSTRFQAEWRVGFGSDFAVRNNEGYATAGALPQAHSTNDCVWHYTFPREGSYQVCLTVFDVLGRSDTQCQHVVVQDWLILGLGDSFGSGQGAPDVPAGKYSSAISDAYSGEYRDDLYKLVQQYRDFLDAEAALRADAACASACDGWDAWSNECRDCREAVEDAEDSVGIAASDIAPERGDEARENARRSWTQFQESVPRAEASFRDLMHRMFGDDKPVVWAPEADLEALSYEPSPSRAGCNRSAKAGLAQAALLLEELDPATSVTFAHLACSGSQVGNRNGIIDQVLMAAALTQHREVDALLLSVGGNDIGFVPIILRCVTSDCTSNPPAMQTESAEAFCRDVVGQEINAKTLGDLAILVETCSTVQERGGVSACEQVFGVGNCPDEHVRPILTQCDKLYERLAVMYNTDVATCTQALQDLIGMHDVPGRLQELEHQRYPMAASAIQQHLGAQLSDGAGVYQPERVYLQQYPDLSKDKRGDWCQISLLNYKFTPQEFQWTFENVQSPLNAIQVRAAHAAGWSFTEGVLAASTEHGVCAGSKAWVVDIMTSLSSQGDIQGFMHPNEAGYTQQAYQILGDLIRDMYDQDGLPRLPRRTPRPALASPITPRDHVDASCHDNLDAVLASVQPPDGLVQRASSEHWPNGHSFGIAWTDVGPSTVPGCMLDTEVVRSFHIVEVDSQGNAVDYWRDQASTHVLVSGRSFDLAAPADIYGARCTSGAHDWGSFAAVDQCRGIDLGDVRGLVKTSYSSDRTIVRRELCEADVARLLGCPNLATTRCVSQTITRSC